MRVSRRAFTVGAAAALLLPARVMAGKPAILPGDAAVRDFDELFERLQGAHFNLFENRSRAAYLAEHRRLRRQLGPGVSRAQALRIYQRFVAFGRIAHARIDAAAEPFREYRKAGGRIFPLTCKVKDGRLFVMADASASPGVHAGDELLAIAGRSAMPFVDALWKDVSADTPYMFHAMLEWELPRLLWQALGSMDRFDLRVRSGAGAGRRVLVPALTQTEIDKAGAKPALLSIPLEERRHGLIGGDVAYLRPGPFYAVEEPSRPYDNKAFAAFIDEAFRQILSERVDRLVLDFRDNPGGDNSFSDHLVSWFATRPFRFASAFRIKMSEEAVASNRERLAVAGNDPTGGSAALAAAYRGVEPGRVIDFPIRMAQPRSGARFQGKVFVLVNRHTYSNAVNVAALIQDYGFGAVIGEETSDLATTLGAMEQFALSRTGIVVGFPKAQIVRPNGSMQKRGVVPDTLIDTPVLETVDDPVLTRALALVRLV